MNIILLLISLLIFEILIWYVEKNYKIQNSLSASFYELKEDGYGKWFTIALLGFSLPLSLVGVFNNIHLLMFLSGGLISLVGVSPKFKDSKKEERAHLIGAFGGIAFGFLSLIFEWGMGRYMIFASLLGLISLFKLKNSKLSLRNNYIWWGEKAAYYIIWVGLLLSELFPSIQGKILFIY